jgi:LPXTG-motif cell wall-anchored protein
LAPTTTTTTTTEAPTTTIETPATIVEPTTTTQPPAQIDSPTTSIPIITELPTTGNGHSSSMAIASIVITIGVSIFMFNRKTRNYGKAS